MGASEIDDASVAFSARHLWVSDIKMFFVNCVCFIVHYIIELNVSRFVELPSEVGRVWLVWVGMKQWRDKMLRKNEKKTTKNELSGCNFSPCFITLFVVILVIILMMRITFSNRQITVRLIRLIILIII